MNSCLVADLEWRCADTHDETLGGAAGLDELG